MRTTLSPERLAELAAEGRAKAGRSPFVDPGDVAACKRLLIQRGEGWAASVLMRDLSRRSAIGVWPWFQDGEMETLLLAADAEWGQLAQAAGGSA
ncbi:hypothetical protein ACGFJC_47095 [Nonomuraea fuscirosea]|uniref:hypothetical protein n=1 Tax=Nonomuraea fuscirosea TaxID=1291556 RepID=UPI003718DC7D